MKSLAKQYAQLGYPVFPCQKNGKEPNIPNGCRGGTTNDELIAAYWTPEPDANIGIVCTNCFVIDIDVKKGNGYADWQQIKDRVPGIPSAPATKTTTGGCHLFFRLPNRKFPASCGIKLDGRNLNIDIRTGYTYVLAAGSEIDGKKYVSESAMLPVNELPELPEEFFKLIFDKISEKKERPSVPIKRTSYTGTDAITRCREYVAKIPGISEKTEKGNCHKRLLCVANAIFQGFGLQEPEGRIILNEFNDRCDPPWSPAEIDHKVEAAIWNPVPGKPSGWLLNKERPKRAERNIDMSGFLSRFGIEETAVKNTAVKNEEQEPIAPIELNETKEPDFAEESGQTEEESPIPLTQASSVEMEDIKWLWKNHLPKGKMVIVSGKGSAGKTTFVMDLVARVSNGTDWPDGTPGHRGLVIYFYCEDGINDTLCPRLTAAGGDKSRVYFAQFLRGEEGSDGARFSIRNTKELSQSIRQVERATGEKVALIVFDPLSSFMEGIDTNKNSEVREMLVNIPKFLEGHPDTAILGIAHTKKGGNAFESAADLTSGASEFVNVARGSYLVFHDKERDTHLVLPAKWNLGKVPDGIQFDIESTVVPGLTEQYGRCVIQATDYVESADEYLDRKRREKISSGKKNKKSCKDWLEETMADRGCLRLGFSRSGDPPSGSLMALGIDAGYSQSNITKYISVLGLKKYKEDGVTWVKAIDYEEPDECFSTSSTKDDLRTAFTGYSSGDF